MNINININNESKNYMNNQSLNNDLIPENNETKNQQKPIQSSINYYSREEKNTNKRPEEPSYIRKKIKRESEHNNNI